MLSLKDIATIKTVIEICNNPDLKKEILCAPGSDYDRNKGSSINGNNMRWNEIVEEKATAIVENLGVAKQLQEKVISIVFSVGIRMLIWAEYHEGTLGLSREYSVKFINNSFFTPQGIIDRKKAAEELMKDDSINIKQKYTIACLYCFTDHIPVLFRQLTTQEKEDFCNTERPLRIKQPEIVTFWSYYLMGDLDKLMGGKNIDHLRLEKAVRSGSETAVEYCFEKINLRTKMNVVIDAATEAVRCRMHAEEHTDKNWVFQNQMYKNCDKSWVPSDYFTDILCFLLSKMEEDQQIEFFKKDTGLFECEEREAVWRVQFDFIEGIRINTIRQSNNGKCFLVLEYFLNWPYQNYFMQKVKLMWEFLSEMHYAILLLMICEKIESKFLFSKYGEGESFDYRELLKEFWCQSPDRYKRHVFNNKGVIFNKKLITGTGLLIKLLTLKNFTYEDGETIKLILTSATSEEKETIFCTEEWITICVKLIEEEKWETLERYTLYCFLSKEEEYKFKQKLSFSKQAQSVCINFSKNDQWNAAESFIKWSSLTEEEIKKLKEEMIYSDYGLLSCVRQILSDKVRAIKFIRWYLPSEEKIKAFKKELIFNNYFADVSIYVNQNKQELLTEFLNFCLSSEEEVRELKKEAAYKYGGLICKDLISNNETVYDYLSHDRGIIRRIKFKGGKWEEVEKFLTSYLSTEEEISDFKKNVLLKNYGEEIHFKLIESNQWEEAEIFFAWLDLSVEEIKELKKRTLFDYFEARDMFIELMYSEDDDERFSEYGSKHEAIELLLRWYLTDKEMVLECKDKLLEYLHQDIEDKLLKNLDLIIEQRVRDLDYETRE